MEAQAGGTMAALFGAGTEGFWEEVFPQGTRVLLGTAMEARVREGKLQKGRRGLGCSEAGENP